MADFDNAVKWTAGGLDAIHVAQRMGTGLFGGYAGLTAASTPGTGSGMRKLLGAQTAPFGTSETPVKPILGDDIVIDSFQFGLADVSRAMLILGANDGTFDNDAAGVSKKTVGVYDFYGQGDSIANPKSWMFLLTRQAHGKDSGNDGIAGWENELVLATQVQPLKSESKAHQAEGSFRQSVLFNQATKTYWGETCQSAFGTVYRKSIIWASRLRCMIHVFIGDGTEDTFVMDYTPDVVATTKAWNGTTAGALTVSTVTPSTKEVVLSAAPGSGVPIIFLYQTPAFAA